MTHKIAVVTGAGSGLGKALSIKLAKDGVKVYAIGRTENKLRELVANNTNLIPIHADLATQAGRELVFQATKREAQIDYLVHCAAVIEPLIPMTLLKQVEWQQAMSSNVEAPLFLTQLLLPKLIASKVLFVTSELAVNPVQGASAYCITKSALNMVYQSFKTEVPCEKASFGLVSPGLIDTPMQKKIRCIDKTVLPASEVLVQLHQNGQLISSRRSAKFLTWLLTDVKPETFASQCWDIYDERMLPQWDK